MKKKAKGSAARAEAKKAARTPLTTDAKVAKALAWLEKKGTQETRDGMARQGITAAKAFGVPVGTIHRLARAIGKDHALALELWETGWYEARLLCAFIDVPERVTAAQMERWCKGFDSWSVCDTLCFHLFDRSSHAFAKIEAWAGREDEFQKRAAFALLASVALHRREATQRVFRRGLELIEAAAEDERIFVKKGVSWALRVLGRRDPELHEVATELARKLSASKSASARWIGKEALRDLGGPIVKRQLAKRAARA